MSDIRRTLAAGALLSMLAALAACTPPHRHERPPRTQHEIANTRLRQVDGRIDELGHRINRHVSEGHYQQPMAEALHHRLDVIRGEAHDMAGRHGGGLTPGEQRVLNEELDTATHAID